MHAYAHTSMEPHRYISYRYWQIQQSSSRQLHVPSLNLKQPKISFSFSSDSFSSISIPTVHMYNKLRYKAIQYHKSCKAHGKLILAPSAETSWPGLLKPRCELRTQVYSAPKVRS